MKIGQMPSTNRAATTQTQSKQAKAVPGKTAPAPSADDITQQGLQTAQLSLNNDAESDVDYDKVAKMQAALAAGEFTVDPDSLADSMLNFFQK
ncbi:flagellar biosynthesis anti-sigma factor FlgM [Buttiauxella gaviniae]|uniref:flagellar biosynthesis anti-sigma factor FlgM n=1 Tax=Buttiauxella gaviniae TaxID=82990 RepID=UPI003974D1A0